MSKELRRVAITGAEGNIGQGLAAGLKDRYRLRLCHLGPIADVPGAESVVKADLSEAAQVNGLFEGCDAVVHLAAIHRSGPSFHDVLGANIVGTYNVLEEAKRAGLRKVVFASTNHVQNAYVTGDTRDPVALVKEFADSGRRIRETDPPAPDSYYGVSKLFGEDLGRYYASYLKCLQFVAVRIGWAAPADPRSASREKIMRSDDVERHYRSLFLSRRDCLDLFTRSIEVDTEFLVVYATSNNPSPMFDLEGTRRSLGYEPKDSSESFFAQVLAG